MKPTANQPLLCIFLGLLFLATACTSDYTPDERIAAQLPEEVDFNFHIKPILSDRCFSCHGPDKNAVKADLQLHTSFGGLEQVLSSGEHAFVSKNLAKSEAFQRMIAVDPEQKMPPPDFERSLSPYEIALIAKWIKQGATYKPHWAFIPPTPVELPKLQEEAWAKNEVDFFIKKKLEEQGIMPNEEADKEILLRRLSLDLTGLPPSLKELDDFLSDESPDAYEKVVDRLLASPHFGEKMALMWLDLARYADSNGYSQDGLRIMWPWRDWVIQAFNENMPYDRFLSWQLAGDKLPDASQEQKLATGFLRNHRLNGEGGIVDEEYRIEYAADRTETAATVFLGLTLQCARCHDHKYDPISQEEYYKFFSYFNSVHESGLSANDGNSGPQIELTSPEVEARIAYLDRKTREEEKHAAQIAEKVLPASYKEPRLTLTKDLLIALSFDEIKEEALVNQVDRAERFKLTGEIKQVEGAIGRALKFTAFDFARLVKKELDFDRADAFSFSFYLKLEEETPFLSILNHLGSGAVNYPGYEIAIVDDYPMIRLVHELPANLIEVRGTQKIPKGEWVGLTFTYDGSGSASGISIYRQGERAESNIVFDKLTQRMSNQRSTLTIGGMIGYQTDVKGSGCIDELNVYNRKLSAIEVYQSFHSSQENMPHFSDEHLQEHFLLNTHVAYKKVLQNIQQLRKEKFHIQDTLVSVMVMEDLPEPRPTYILARGVYDAPEKRVSPGTPTAILPVSAQLKADRWGLSEWLLHKENPLTARVAVNRFWHMYLGAGIVKTTDDFGNQGALPSHPELLDWLSLRFVASGWDIKALQKLIVMSATYRQSSRVPADVRVLDPDNILLARGPSRRLSAELIRDCALAASGLLSKKIGGPGVKPYQPAGLWEEKGEFSKLKNYKQDKGVNLYRRSLYTFWRRSSPPPSMTTFDAPTRDICIVSRQETNTPLQALVLLNDPQFVEASRVLAERVILSNSDKGEQISQAHRLLTSLKPDIDVLSLLRDLEQKEHLKFSQETHVARELLGVGEYPIHTGLDMAEVAAMTVVVSTIMSFDETLIKR